MKTKNVSVDQIKMYLDPIIFARSLFGFTEVCQLGLFVIASPPVVSLLSPYATSNSLLSCDEE